MCSCGRESVLVCFCYACMYLYICCCAYFNVVTLSVFVCLCVYMCLFAGRVCLFVCLFVFISLCAYACIQCLRPMPPIQPRTRAPTIDNVDHGIVVGHDDDDDDVDAGRGDDGWWVDWGIL
jgi:hypothetical protein